MNHFGKIRKKNLTQECVFTASKSSGAGGQHVNKVNTKVTLRFDVNKSAWLSAEEKEILHKKLASKISVDGFLILTAQTHRSQLKNKEETVLKFNQLIEKAFKVRKTRKATKPSKAAVKKRLDEKKRQAEKKKWRQKT